MLRTYPVSPHPMNIGHGLRSIARERGAVNRRNDEREQLCEEILLEIGTQSVGNIRGLGNKYEH